MSSSGECSDVRNRAHHVSISSGDQTLQVPQTPQSPIFGHGKCRCAHCDCCGTDAADQDGEPSTSINSDDLFQQGGDNDPRWRYMTWAQQNDPVWRIVQSFHGQACIALREMDREIIRATKGFVDGCRSGGMDHWKYAHKLRKIMPERTAFVQSLATLETLPEPSRKDVEDMVDLYPTGDDEGRQKISPFTSQEHWKSLRRVSRQKKLADSIPWLGSIGKWVSRPFRLGRDEVAIGQGRRVTVDKYKDRCTQNAILVVCSVVIGVFVSIPVVLLGMDVGSKGIKLAVIVFFIVFFGVGSAYWLDDPAIAIATMLAFAASLVNVSV